MTTERTTVDLEYEPEDAHEDAHEHGVVFTQVEGQVPLLPEDADDDEDLAADAG